MYNQAQKQRFVTTMVNNVGYFNKQQTVRQINQFLKYNPQFSPREAIRQNNNNSFISFIQITGFVLVGNSHVEMYIGVPIKFPGTPPLFLLSIDRSNYLVNDEQKLLQHKLIAAQKNERGEDFIRLRFGIVQKQWNPNMLTLHTVFLNLMQIINRPPIIRPKVQNNIKPVSSFQKISSPEKIKKLNSKQVTEVIQSFNSELVQIIVGKQSLLDAAESLDYTQCRQQFMKNHLSVLRSKLAGVRSSADVQSEALRNDYKQIQQSGQVSKLLEISPAESIKLQILSQQQALKEAEVKLRSKMQKDSSTKFSDYKKIMKVLYEKMFDNQTKLLKSAK